MQQPSIQFSGQISSEDISAIAQHGFKSVINNRPDLEGGTEQPRSEELALLFAENQINYVYQPVISSQITELDVQAFAQHINTLPKPILVFCRTGARSNNLYQLAKQMDLLDHE